MIKWLLQLLPNPQISSTRVVHAVPYDIISFSVCVLLYLLQNSRLSKDKRFPWYRALYMSCGQAERLTFDSSPLSIKSVIRNMGLVHCLLLHIFSLVMLLLA